MDVDTLLTRQMELHSSVRRPPKNAEQLMQLRETMRDYHKFFAKLRSLSLELSAEEGTIFQCLMHISVGGVVNFDRQHQDGAMPMHQAKVLARTSAIALEPAVREAVPHKELMVYVGQSKDLRTMLRVKVEDSNDLATAEKSVNASLEYLNFIFEKARGDAGKMYDFYMVEDPVTLCKMLEGLEELSSPMLSVSLKNFSPVSSLVADSATIESLPDPLSTFAKALGEHGIVAAANKRSPAERMRATQTMLDWLTLVPIETFVEQIDAIFEAVTDPLAALVNEKRSTLCRTGCEVIIIIMQRIAKESWMREELSHTTGAATPLSMALSRWSATLAKRVFVTIAAISGSTDHALREVVIGSHGHAAVVKAVLAALESGPQTELRRRCLGYLALCLVSARSLSKSRMKVFSGMLVTPAQKFVQTGDSPTRKMARALCAVLRMVGGEPTPIGDEKIEKLICFEQDQISEALDNPRDFEHFLFEANNFVSSMRISLSASSSLLVQSNPVPTPATAVPVLGVKKAVQLTSSGGPQRQSPSPHLIRPVSRRRSGGEVAISTKRPLQLSPIQKHPDGFELPTSATKAGGEPISSTSHWPLSARMETASPGQRANPLPALSTEVLPFTTMSTMGGGSHGPSSTGPRLLPLSLIPARVSTPQVPTDATFHILGGKGKQMSQNAMLTRHSGGIPQISDSLRRKIEEGKHHAK